VHERAGLFPGAHPGARCARGCPVSALPEAGPTRALVVRALLYFALWIVVDQSAKPANLVVGLLASAAATWASLKLLPPASGRVRLGLLLLLLPRFLWQSLVAGIDVARRAFAPRLRLQPGFVDYPVGLPRGSARNAFELIASLMPGSLPSGETKDTIKFHCLDTRQPVVEQLAAEERAYARALQPGPRDG
jgi:multicomponent Na+:H+ antiporter subunit E